MNTPSAAGSTRDASAALRARIAALCPDWDATAVSGFIYLEGGYSNANYRFEYGGERYVLRVPQGPRPFVDRMLERRLYASRAEPLPEVVALDTHSGDMISRWVPGMLLADLQPAGSELAAQVRYLHARIPDMEREYDPVAQARTHLEQAEAPDWMADLAARTIWSPPERAPCHNDLNPWNLIRAPEGRWITLDWEWAGLNDPLFDLVTLHQGAGLPDDELAPMARDYAGANVEAARLDACLTAFWLREASWAMAEFAAGNDRPEIRHQADLGTQRLITIARGR